MTNLLNTLGMRQRKGDANEGVYENPRRILVEGKERKTNLALVDNSGLAICKLCNFETQV